MNIFYNPEAFGLEVVAQIEYSSGSYEFDTRVIWRDKQGKLYTARDSGCSCPTPFEDYNLSNIERLIKKDIEKEALNGVGAEATDFIKTLKKL